MYYNYFFRTRKCILVRTQNGKWKNFSHHTTWFNCQTSHSVKVLHIENLICSLIISVQRSHSSQNAKVNRHLSEPSSLEWMWGSYKQGLDPLGAQQCQEELHGKLTTWNKALSLTFTKQWFNSINKGKHIW